MPKFRVYIQTVASAYVEIEADDGDAAVEKAFEEGNFPYAPGFAEYEFGEWTTPSELFPEQAKSEDDYELIES
ncbi:MAG: hypothetical protein K0S70_194 [Microbacterium sp.]|jgi:hypothetical protein|nr:hypothetical protein [Microbacterium sp.]